jgi:hypothetical protein
MGDDAKSSGAYANRQLQKSSGTADETGPSDGDHMPSSGAAEPKVASPPPPKKSDEQVEKVKDSSSAHKTNPPDSGSPGVPSPIPTPDKGDIVLSHVCVAPPDGIGVAWLKSQGVPAKVAPGILLRWRSTHGKGDHEVCRASRQLGLIEPLCWPPRR